MNGAQPTALLWVLVGMMLASTALAGNWTLAPRFQIEETYTDNVNLTENDRSGRRQRNEHHVLLNEVRQLDPVRAPEQQQRHH